VVQWARLENLGPFSGHTHRKGERKRKILVAAPPAGPRRAPGGPPEGQRERERERERDISLGHFWASSKRPGAGRVPKLPNETDQPPKRTHGGLRGWVIHRRRIFWRCGDGPESPLHLFILHILRKNLLCSGSLVAIRGGSARPRRVGAVSLGPKPLGFFCTRRLLSI
jgi:hypothetical protein